MFIITVRTLSCDTSCDTRCDTPTPPKTPSIHRFFLLSEHRVQAIFAFQYFLNMESLKLFKEFYGQFLLVKISREFHEQLLVEPFSDNFYDYENV